MDNEKPSNQNEINLAIAENLGELVKKGLGYINEDDEFCLCLTAQQLGIVTQTDSEIEAK